MPSPQEPPLDAEALFQTEACGLLLTDADGTIRRVNRTFCRSLGYEAEALVDRRTFQSLLTMGGRIFQQTHWLPLLLIQGSVAEIKLELVHADRRKIPAMMNAVRQEGADRSYHQIAIFTAQDRHRYERELLQARTQAETLLTQQREAQLALTLAREKLRLAFDASQLYLWEIDPLSGRRSYEDDVSELLGVESVRPVDEAEYTAAIDVADRAGESAALAAAMQDHGERYSYVYRLNGIDGQQRTVSSLGRAIFADDGAMIQFNGVIRDITDAVRQRVVIEDRALFAEQMIGIVSHDLRNPLTAVSIGAEMLGRKPLADSQLRMLGHIVSAGQRALRMVGDLLDFTRARVGHGMALKLRAIDLRQVIAEAVDELTLSYQGRELVYRHLGEAVCTADPDRLVQAIGNLVSNAMTYGDSGSAVTVTSCIGDGRCRVAVRNRGAPIEAELIGTLFEPMVRGDAAGASRSVGLGLYIVREIVRAHQGEVHFESRGAETTFVLSFPSHVEAHSGTEQTH